MEAEWEALAALVLEPAADEAAEAAAEVADSGTATEIPACWQIPRRAGTTSVERLVAFQVNERQGTYWQRLRQSTWWGRRTRSTW
jgi:hypothetical protein